MWRFIVSKTIKSTKGDPTSNDSLYHLKVTKRDDENGCIKVRYIRYGEEYNEWKLIEDIAESSSTSTNKATTILIQTVCLSD